MLKVNLQMMQNSHSPLPTSSSSSSHCLYLRNTRAVASSCSDRSVSWSGGVFSNLYFKKWNWQNNICLRWGDIYVVHFQDGTVRLLGVEAGLYLAMNRFHISTQILFLIFRPFCTCLTKWTTTFPKRSSLRSLWHYTWMTPQKRGTIWKPRRSGPILPFHWGKRRLGTYLPQP